MTKKEITSSRSVAGQAVQRDMLQFIPVLRGKCALTRSQGAKILLCGPHVVSWLHIYACRLGEERHVF